MDSKSVGNTAIKKFLNENKSVKYMLPVLIVLILIFIVFLVSGGFNKGGKSIPSSKNSETSMPLDGDINDELPRVEVLPQTIRSNNPENTEVNKDPFEAIMKLVGVVHSGEQSTAIIEWGEYSYIVRNNEKIGDSDWKVANIERNSITLISGDNNSIVLDLSEGSIEQ